MTKDLEFKFRSGTKSTINVDEFDQSIPWCP